MLNVTSLRAEYRSDTGQVAVPRPRLSWTTETDATDWLQTGADLEWTVADHATATHLDGRDSHLTPWPFDDLAPRETGALRVRVTGADGVESEWSEPLEITGGFLGPHEWVAEFVGAAGDQEVGSPILLRTEFQVKPGLQSATLYATAQGSYQAKINGADVDDQVLKPGWTPYQYRIVHETTDVMALLRDGANVLGADVAGGWFTESYGFRGLERPLYGENPSFAAQLVLAYADGTHQVVTTGEGWFASAQSPRVSSSIYQGEHYDARREQGGWSEPGFDAKGWQPARVMPAPVVPSARTSPIVRVTEEVPVREVTSSPTGRTLLDFGQNLVGRLRIRVSGPAGHTVTLRHAEVLEDGELATRPLRRAAAVDSYTLSGDGVEEWAPAFTFHGFRYAEIENWPGKLNPDDITAEVIHSDMERTGWFSSSHDQVNQLHENVVWGMRGNFLYVPTDCPQRDERFGWTGDIQVFAPTASYLYEVNGFLASWLTDLALEQVNGGGVPFIVPDVLDSAKTPAAAWGDAAVVVPWVLYERFGDAGVLSEQFHSMKAWVDQILGVAGDRRLWEGRFQFGDWLDPASPPDQPAAAKTDADIVASAYLFRSTDLLARSAEVLGRTKEAATYSAIAEEIREAWLREFVTPTGRMVSDAQTAYSLAIEFGLPTDPTIIQRMGDRLAWLVRRDGYRIGTGFVGTPLVQDALVRTGHADTAARLLLQTENPSWLYPVTMGATTIWERWDSMLEDGTINPGEMTSFNHYAFGAIADWLHRAVGGLAPASPAYRTIRISPRPLIGLDWAETSHETPAGMAKVRWEAGGGGVTVTATVPPNTTAFVELPGRDPFEVGSGSHSWTIDDPRPAVKREIRSMKSSLADIIDDPEAYSAVVSAVLRSDPDLARSLRRTTKWVDEQALSAVVWLSPNETVNAIEQALLELNKGRK
jgi:alpha-L-rhamnosidase